ncbi:hypothetical protein BaRGS_00012681, partial [Batillaria attramentaria]
MWLMLVHALILVGISGLSLATPAADTCPALRPPAHGIMVPYSCVTSASPVNSACVVFCQEGYDLIGPDTITCTASGQWDNNGQEPACTGYSSNTPSHVTTPSHLSGSPTTPSHVTSPTTTFRVASPSRASSPSYVTSTSHVTTPSYETSPTTTYRVTTPFHPDTPSHSISPSSGTTTTPSAATVTTTRSPIPSATLCEDKVTDAGSFGCGHSNVCNDSTLARYVCPKSCGFCDFAHEPHSDCLDKLPRSLCLEHCHDSSIGKLLCPITCALTETGECTDYAVTACGDIPGVCNDASSALRLCPKFCGAC